MWGEGSLELHLLGNLEMCPGVNLRQPSCTNSDAVAVRATAATPKIQDLGAELMVACTR